MDQENSNQNSNPPENIHSTPINDSKQKLPQKSFLKKPIFWITVAILFLFAGGYYISYSTLDNILPDEVSTFPIYPNSKYVTKKVIPPCNEEVLGCDSIIISWETLDDGDKVLEWYKDEKLHTGWICGVGGAGSYGGPRDIGFTSTCKNLSKVYGFQIIANQSKTIYFLSIRND